MRFLVQFQKEKPCRHFIWNNGIHTIYKVKSCNPQKDATTESMRMSNIIGDKLKTS